LPDDHPPGGGREDHPSAAALPLRTLEGGDVPASLPRRGDRPFDDLPHPQTPRNEPAARLPALQAPPQKRWKRYEKQRLGHKLQIDVKFVEPITAGTGRRGRRYYQYTAIDDCTRLRILKLYPRSDQKTAIQFLDYVLPRLPFQVEKIQTDNDAEFQSAFHWHVLDQGIGHVYIRPATLRLNGKVERSHRIDAEEFYRLLDGVVLGDLGTFNDKLKEWEDYYNHHRPHGGFAGQTPYERLLSKTRPHAQAVNDLQQQHT
jgi:transposase InsO family protein